MPIVLLLAACGDNTLVDPEQGGPDEEEGAAVEPHFAPDVCTARSWPSLPFADRDVDMTVVPTATGAAVFTVERAGGPLRGFAIDGRGELETKEGGNTLRDDFTFTKVSAAYIDERLITAAVTDEGSVAIDMIRPDLGATYNLSVARGTMVTDLPIAQAREQRFATIADINDGITGIRFDGSWSTAGTQTLAPKAPLSITAARYRDDSMVVWSTESTCTLTRVAAQVTSERAFPCLNGRLAMNVPERSGYMIYEEANKLMISEIRVGGESEIANTRMLLENARAPKIVFDGTRYWVSYINDRQDVVVGYLSEQGSLVGMALEGTQPMADAYELAFVQGAVWVFSIDGAGAGAQRLCLKPVR